MPAIDSYPLLLAAVAACDDKKAEDIRILKLDPTESGLSDYFVICNGTNTRQNVAITDEVELRLKREFGVYPNAVEGRREGDWVLMDYVDFILHVFSPEKREFYGLERLRKTATVVSAAELNEELKQQVKAARAKAPVVKKAAAAKPLSKPASRAKKVPATQAETATPERKRSPAKKLAAKNTATVKNGGTGKAGGEKRSSKAKGPAKTAANEP